MGYYSSLVIKDNMLVTHKCIKDPVKLQVRAQAVLEFSGSELTYWLYLESDNAGRVTIEATGESGKAYSFTEDFKNFASAMNRAGLLLNGTMYLEGEAVGDLTRIVVSDNEVTAEKAKLVFSDGEVY